MTDADIGKIKRRILADDYNRDDLIDLIDECHRARHAEEAVADGPRVRRVAVTYTMLESALLLPDGARIVGADHDRAHDQVVLTVSSPAFPPVPPLHPIPFARPEYGHRSVSIPEFQSWGI